MDSILFAFIFVLAVKNGCERLVGDILESLRTTNIAGVSVNLQKWLNLGDPCNNSTDSDQSPKRCTLNIANRYRNVACQRFKVEITILTRQSTVIASLQEDVLSSK